MFLGTLGAISLAEGTKSAGWAMAFIVICMISIFLLVLFIFCAAQKLMNSIARQESEQHWMHRGMKWEVVYQRDPDKGRYYFQLWVIPNTVAFEPRKEVLSDEKNAIRQALIAWIQWVNYISITIKISCTIFKRVWVSSNNRTFYSYIYIGRKFWNFSAIFLESIYLLA